jgi:deoxyribonuclease V
MWIRGSKLPPKAIASAAALQNELRDKVVLKDDFKPFKVIAGVDCSYDIDRNLSRAVIVLMDYKKLELFYSIQVYAPTTFPYIPGYLSFREVPVIQEALKLLPQTPDLLVVDGQGVAHPRRLGLAAHLGVITGLPSIGIAKSRLIGTFKDIKAKKGSTSPLLHKGEIIGTVLRSKDGCKPLFISAGHRVSHETALKIALHCLKTYRLPEPTRIADMMSKWRPVKNDTATPIKPALKEPDPQNARA